MTLTVMSEKEEKNWVCEAKRTKESCLLFSRPEWNFNGSFQKSKTADTIVLNVMWPRQLEQGLGSGGQPPEQPRQLQQSLGSREQPPERPGQQQQSLGSGEQPPDRPRQLQQGLGDSLQRDHNYTIGVLNRLNFYLIPSHYRAKLGIHLSMWLWLFLSLKFILFYFRYCSPIKKYSRPHAFLRN